MKIEEIVNKLERCTRSLEDADMTIDVGSVTVTSFSWDDSGHVDVDLDDAVVVTDCDNLPTRHWKYIEDDDYIEVIDELKSIQGAKDIDHEAIQQRLDQATKLIGEAYRLLEGDQL
jgi:hypothetical protein